jgi:hypothetical protein
MFVLTLSGWQACLKARVFARRTSYRIGNASARFGVRIAMLLGRPIFWDVTL